MNKIYTYLMPVVLTLAVLWAIIPAFNAPEPIYSASQPNTPDNDKIAAAPAHNTATREVYMIAREHNGNLCLFLPDENSPKLTLDVNVASLPKPDRDMFSLGVNLYSNEEVTMLIEDYTS